MTQDLERTGGPFREAPLAQGIASPSPSPRIVLREDGDELLVEARAPHRWRTTGRHVLAAGAIYWAVNHSTHALMLPLLAAGFGVAYALATLRAATTETRLRIRDDVLSVEVTGLFTGLLGDTSFRVALDEIGDPFVASRSEGGRTIYLLRIPAAAHPDQVIHLLDGHPAPHLEWLSRQISAWLQRRRRSAAAPLADPRDEI